MCLLAQTNPMAPIVADEMHEMRETHSRQICGIVAHVKDRGVASVSLRSLAIAAECLVVRKEQEEVLEILEKIKKETGWRIDFLKPELKSKWGWKSDEEIAMEKEREQQQQQAANNVGMNGGLSTTIQQPQPQRPKIPQGILNPMYAKADFTAPVHPYQSYYVAPNHIPQMQTHFNF